MNKDFLRGISKEALRAATLPEQWSPTLDMLADYFGAKSVTLYTADREYATRQDAFVSRYLREEGKSLYDFYRSGQDADDTAAIRFLNMRTPCSLVTEPEFYGVDSMDQVPDSETLNYYRNAHGIHFRIASSLNHYGDRADVVSLHFTDKHGPADMPAFRQDTDLLFPIMSTSLQHYRIFSALFARFNAMLGALDRLGIGTILLNAECEIILSNGHAKAILALDDGVSRDRFGKLYLSVEEDSQRSLSANVTSSWKTAHSQAWHGTHALSVKRPSGKTPFLVSIDAILDARSEIQRDMGCVMLQIFDPAEVTPLSCEGLKLVGGLTDIETSVCDMIVQGHSTTEIAEHRDVSPETIKSQSGAILRKLGAKSRHDLVKMAALTRIPISEGRPN